MKNEQWRKSTNRFLAMTGMTTEAFDALLPYFEEAHSYYFSHYDIHGKAVLRTRSYTIYNNSPLSTVSERLAFILSYLKLNPIQEQHADLFGMTQKQCNLFVHTLLRILEMAIKDSGVMPARTKDELMKKLENLPEEFNTNRQLIHDGTEREVPRPTDHDKQQEYYSGKKKSTRLRMQ
jgi:hypothetical protein